MPYLDPPPAPAPVVVVKDVGGFVDAYRDQTERYRREDREVRLHECRSACTLALSLPNVCVYPYGTLKFHKAYNVNTKEADEGVSRELFNAYPPAVRARLGDLTRQYRVLRGAELIELGVRDCSEKRTIMVAKNTPPAARGAGIAQAMGSLVASLLPGEIAAQPRASATASAVRQPIPQRVATLDPKAVEWRSAPSVAPVPSVLPPERPSFEASFEIPLPPRRPVQIATIVQATPLELHPPDLIHGAVPPIPDRFLSYAPKDAMSVEMILRAVR